MQQQSMEQVSENRQQHLQEEQMQSEVGNEAAHVANDHRHESVLQQRMQNLANQSQQVRQLQNLQALMIRHSDGGTSHSKSIQKAQQPPVQRVLTAYAPTTGKQFDLNTYDEILHLKKKRRTPLQEIKDEVNAGINEKLAAEADDGEEAIFNEGLMNQFIQGPIDGYPDISSLKGLIDTLADFYQDGITALTTAATTTEGTANYTNLIATYAQAEADDGEEVAGGYERRLACTLYALIAVKGNFLGADTPEKLHYALRAIPKFRIYDDDNTVGLIRLQAGLTYANTYAGRTVAQMIAALGVGDQGRKFIIDMIGVPHTFALKYVAGAGAGWKRFDNGSEDGYNTGVDVGAAMNANRISVTWE